MPEYAALAIGGVLGGGHRLFYREILVIPRQDLKCVLTVHVEADKIPENIQKPGFLKYPLKKCIKLGVCRVLIAAVPGFPLHEPVLAGGDGPGLGDGQVAHNADGVIDEQGRDLVHVVAQLPVGRRGVRLLTGGGFQLHHHQREAVHEQHHVQTLLGVLHHRPLVDDGEVVAGGVVVVDEVHQGGALLAVHEVFDGHAVLQAVHEYHVLLQQRPALEVLQLVDRLVEGFQGQGGIDPPQAGQQDILIEWAVVVPRHVGAV